MKIAALENFQRGEKLTLKEIGAAAVVRQRGHRADHRHLAHVARAVVALHRPDRHEQRLRDPELLLDAGEQRAIALHQLLGAVDARRDHASRGVFLEGLAEGAALAPVEGEHAGILRDAGESTVDHRARDPAAVASRAMAETNVLKSPPHVAARAGAANASAQIRTAIELNDVVFFDITSPRAA